RKRRRGHRSILRCDAAAPPPQLFDPLQHKPTLCGYARLVLTLSHVTPHTVRAARTVKLARYLSNLGYGTKREVERMLVSRQITLADGTVLKDGAQDAPPHELLRVMGVP